MRSCMVAASRLAKRELRDALATKKSTKKVARKTTAKKSVRKSKPAVEEEDED